MQCIKPIKAGFDQAGNIVYSSSKMSKELEPFAFPCRKCLPCRINIGREKAIRAVHESMMHKDSIFLTMTYNEESLKSPRLNYLDFQLFMKRLLEDVNKNIIHKENRIKIPFMVTGEYGDKFKRPHWHALLFNLTVPDREHLRSTDMGEHVYKSEYIQKLWQNQGNIEFGSVTMDSASYVARYAAKKLIHGKDQDHDYHPVHKTSSRHAIGKSWIEKNWQETFRDGYIVLPNGEKTAIPRFYNDWFRKNHPDQWMQYQSTVAQATKTLAEEKRRKEEIETLSNIMSYKGDSPYPLTRPQVKERVLKKKFDNLQGYLKL